jgi:hypothetical protein
MCTPVREREVPFEGRFINSESFCNTTICPFNHGFIFNFFDPKSRSIEVNTIASTERFREPAESQVSRCSAWIYRQKPTILRTGNESGTCTLNSTSTTK